MRDHLDAPETIVAKMRLICDAMAEAREERAWVGTRWRIRTKTFAHVVPIENGWPPAYVRAAGTSGPATLLTFRASGEDHEAYAALGHPFCVPGWWPDIVGVFLDEATDWTEIGELISESYRLVAPMKLRNQ